MLSLCFIMLSLCFIMLSLCFFIMLHYAFLIVTYNTIILLRRGSIAGQRERDELVLGGRRREPAIGNIWTTSHNIAPYFITLAQSNNEEW